MESKDYVTQAELEMIRKEIDKVDKLLDILNKQTIAVEKLAIEMQYMRDDQNKMEVRLKDIEQKPTKRFDSIVTSIISTIIALIIGVLATLVGLKK